MVSVVKVLVYDLLMVIALDLPRSSEGRHVVSSQKIYLTTDYWLLSFIFIQSAVLGVFR
jgi:hypothetical protein